MMYRAVGLTIAMLVAALGAPTGHAQEAKAGSESGPQEGIQVHGHWIIEVRDPDGSLVERRDFHNDLVSGANGGLARVLARVFTIGAWIVSVAPEAGTRPCSTVAGCTITEPNVTTVPGPHKNLVVEGSTSGLRLRGHMVADQNGTISAVSTAFEFCTPTTTPTECAEGALGQNAPFTKATIAPISVQNGQQVLVTVTISFS